MADFIEGYLPMKQHVLVRFGKWREIIDAGAARGPRALLLDDGDDALRQGGRAFDPGRIAEAEKTRAAFLEAKARVPETRRVHNNTVVDLLAIADGDAERRARISSRATSTSAFAHLRRSVELDDALPYDEPWGWMQPARHALGALLLEQGHVEEAEAVYRADLGFDGTLSRACQHPENVWSLHGSTNA